MAVSDVIKFGYGRDLKIFCNNDINNITFTAPFDGWCIGEFFGSGWGYAGKELLLGFIQNSRDEKKLTRVHEYRCRINGGDLISKPLHTSAIFTNMIKGNNYTLLSYAINGTDKIGQIIDFRYRIYCFSGALDIEDLS